MPVVPIVPGNQAPDLADVFDVAMRRMSLRLRVCMPAKVVNVLGPQFVDLKPLLQKNVDGVLTDYPIVSGALVCMPIGGDYRMSWALKAGDTGVMLCADRSLDSYAASDGTQAVDPADPRSHELTDGIFMPGLVPHAKQTALTDDMILANGKLTLRLQKDGKLSVDNGVNEMMALLVKTTDQLSILAGKLAQALVLTSLGPAPFAQSSVADFVQVQTSMADVKARLQTLQGSP